MATDLKIPADAVAPRIPGLEPGPYVPARVRTLAAEAMRDAWQHVWNSAHVADLRRVLPAAVYGIAPAVTQVNKHVEAGTTHASQNRGDLPFGYYDELTRLQALVQVQRKQVEARYNADVSALLKHAGGRTDAPDYHPHNEQAQRQHDNALTRAQESPVTGVIEQLNQRIARAREIPADSDTRAEIQTLRLHLQRRLLQPDDAWKAEQGARPIGEEDPSTLALAMAKHVLIDTVAWRARAAKQIVERLQPQANFVFTTISEEGRYLGTMRSRIEGHVGGREVSPVQDLEPVPDE